MVPLQRLKKTAETEKKIFFILKFKKVLRLRIREPPTQKERIQGIDL
jgi:hypothetical protein